jgi:hypothetical protein
MLPFPHILEQYYLGSSGYPLRKEAGLYLKLNTSVNGRSTIFTGNKAVGCLCTGAWALPRQRRKLIG